MKRLVIFVGLVLIPFVTGTADAQTDESSLPPTDYGSGYKIIIFHQHQEHDPGTNDDPAMQGPITLDTTYPLVVSPLTPDANVFNSEMKNMATKWWEAMGAPKDNTQASDPDTNYSLDCEPVGLPPPTDAPSPQNAQMLPGIISAACGNYIFDLGAAHGGGENWGLNWIVGKRRTVLASDVFNANSKWLTTLTTIVNSDRGYPGQAVQQLDFSDTSHWVISSVGLGFSYSMNDFSGAGDGGMGTIDFVPWSKLKPYLRKDGIVPKADWSATLPPT